MSFVWLEDWHLRALGVDPARYVGGHFGEAELSDDGRVLAVALVWVDQFGSLWAEYGGAPRAVHVRRMRKMFAILADEGFERVFAQADARIPNAAKFLKRMGFVHIEQGVYVHGLSGVSGGSEFYRVDRGGGGDCSRHSHAGEGGGAAGARAAPGGGD